MKVRKNGSKTAATSSRAGDRGRFQPGNPGRPKGARHKTTIAVEALFDGDAEKLTRKAIEKALEGDTMALRLCLDRIAPARKDRTISFELPTIATPADVLIACAAILAGVTSGEIAPSEAAELSKLLDGYRSALTTVELEARIAKLEAAQRNITP